VAAFVSTVVDPRESIVVIWMTTVADPVDVGTAVVGVPESTELAGGEPR